MAFTGCGIVFLILFGVQLAYEEFFLPSELEIDGHPVRINNSEIIPVVSF
jgi:palmitoyltransferase